jgi:NTE family protein
MAGTTIDVMSVLGGIFGRGSISDRVKKRYAEILFGQATLQDLPDTPRFVINATSVQTGSLMRFSKKYIADWQVGVFPSPRHTIAEAVTASSAFPPVLSPAVVEFGPNDFSEKPGSCHRPPFTTRAVLTDGGVYDNMGIETAWKRCRTILVSDAGAKLQPEDNPPGDWARHALRINSLIDNQVRSLRKRQVVSAFEAKVRNGAYWGMFTDPAEYPAASNLAIPAAPARKLAETPTRLAEVPADLQNRLINFGYGMAERAVRSFVDANAFKPSQFPFPGGI